MKFAIRVEEVFSRTVIVEAKDVCDAIEIVEKAVNDNEILIDFVNDFAYREVNPSTVFVGGVVPDDRDVSHFEHLNVDN